MRTLQRILSRVPLTIFPLLVLLASAALVIASDGMTASQGTPISITGPDGVCKLITNNSSTGLSEYIPTATVAEWQSFVANPPAGVTLAACAPACSGKSVGGFCWYAATSVSQSCTTVCASHGGYNSGTLSYVGSGGSNANCAAVVAALTGTTPSPAGGGNGIGSQPMGCVYAPYISGYSWALRFFQVPTTEGATGSGGDMRVCACNN